MSLEVGNRSAQQDEIVMSASEFKALANSQLDSRFSSYGHDCVTRLQKCQLQLKNGSTQWQQSFIIQTSSSKGAAQQEMTVVAMNGKLLIRFGKKQAINTEYSSTAVNKWVVMTAIGAFGICVFLLYKRRILQNQMNVLQHTVQSQIETVEKQASLIQQQGAIIKKQTLQIQQLQHEMGSHSGSIKKIWDYLRSLVSN
mmetsp:Transcript_42836/g.70734  ORF Transcript_42836/g.70734 Transcript_42836/m.70734 type:complete len:198 (+) Transcript_42836:53-646(+)